MPLAATTKSAASTSDRLHYLELISTTLVGLQNAIKNLELRRAFAGLEETQKIDITISEYQAEMAKANAARNLYLARDVSFRPPTEKELNAAKLSVDALDGITVANQRASDIIDSITHLLDTFKKTLA